MYQSGVTQSAPSAEYGGAASGSTHAHAVPQVNGRPASSVTDQPRAHIPAKATAPKSQNGGSSRRIRLRQKTRAEEARSSEAATSPPARANMMPIEGNSSGSQAQPSAW